jgi:hypothetical protein
VPSEELPVFTERLVAAYLKERSNGETFKQWEDRRSDDELVTIASAGTMQVPRRVINERRGAGVAAEAEE